MGKQSKNETNVLQLRKNMTAHVLPHTCASVFDSSLWLSPFSLSLFLYLATYCSCIAHTLATDTHTQTDRAGQLSSRLRLYIEYIHPSTLTNTHVHTGCVEVNLSTMCRLVSLFVYFAFLSSLQIRKCRLFVFPPPLNVIIVFCFELPFVWLPIVCVDFRCTPYYHYYY